MAAAPESEPKLRDPAEMVDCREALAVTKLEDVLGSILEAKTDTTDPAATVD